MTNLIQDGASWLASKLKANAGRSVTYRRGPEEFTVTGTATLQTYHLVNKAGARTTVVSYDWTFTTAELTLGDPKDGDQIEETLNGKTVKWRLMPLGDKPCWEWLDTSGILSLLHTKRVA